MDTFLTQLSFSLSVTGPICLMLFLGILFKRVGFVDDHFIGIASKLVFKVSLPALLFFSIVQADHDLSKSADLVIFGISGNFLFFLVSGWLIRYLVPNQANHGVVLQGGYRSNAAIIALAYVVNAYGAEGMAKAALYVGMLTTLYNIEAVFALRTKSQNDSFIASTTKLIHGIVTNPLILAIAAGYIVSLSGLHLPEVVSKAGHYFANMTLPLALICSGGALSLRSLSQERNDAWIATFLKLVACPILLTFSGFLYGFRGLDLGILFLTSSSPTAAASYVMARAMGKNAELAANIIVLTTLISLVTSTVGIFLLSYWHLI